MPKNVQIIDERELSLLNAIASTKVMNKQSPIRSDNMNHKVISDDDVTGVSIDEKGKTQMGCCPVCNSTGTLGTYCTNCEDSSIIFEI